MLAWYSCGMEIVRSIFIILVILAFIGGAMYLSFLIYTFLRDGGGRVNTWIGIVSRTHGPYLFWFTIIIRIIIVALFLFLAWMLLMDVTGVTPI